MASKTSHRTPQAAGHSGHEGQQPRIVQAYKVPFKKSFEGKDGVQKSTLTGLNTAYRENPSEPLLAGYFNILLGLTIVLHASDPSLGMG